MTSMLRGGKNGQGTDGLAYAGCSCHNSKADHRKAKKSLKQAEKKQWKKESHD